MRHDWLLRLAWIGLGAIHLLPALATVSPRLRSRLYGAAFEGPVDTLLAHRGILFAALVVAALASAFLPEPRTASAAAIGVSVIGYLIVYAAHGAQAGALRTVAFADVAALPLLILVARNL